METGYDRESKTANYFLKWNISNLYIKDTFNSLNPPPPSPSTPKKNSCIYWLFTSNVSGSLNILAQTYSILVWT